MNKLAKLTFFVMLLLTCILIVGCKGKILQKNKQDNK